MKNKLIQQLIQIKKEGKQRLSEMDESIRIKLEDQWDIEHAYYSSALEGSKLDRNEFDILAKQKK
ncbi:MAG: hypothetical protein Q7S47_00905 [bacterium]|nr:hypothetical protein [bacterium]